MKENLFKFNLYLGLLGLGISSLLLTLGSPFMKTWFYIFAWWSFILVIDSLNFRQSHFSPLSESVKDFITLAFISVFIWLVFELFNLRLRNWSYHGLPSSAFERWLGYFLAFATVAPALKELSIFYKNQLGGKKLALFKLQTTSVLLNIFTLVGMASILMPLIWPELFFPLVWIGFVFLIEPINYRLKNDSLLKDWENMDWGRFWSWLMAGLSAGILWELFNYWAGSHWEYTLPYFYFGKVFQMPALGYFGFLPFSFEVFAILTLLFSLKKKLSGKRFLQLVLCINFLIFSAICFMLIDKLTVIH